MFLGVDKGVQTVLPTMPDVFPLQVPNPLTHCVPLVPRWATSWSENQTDEQKRLREAYIPQWQGKVFSYTHTYVEPSHAALPIPKPKAKPKPQPKGYRAKPVAQPEPEFAAKHAAQAEVPAVAAEGAAKPAAQAEVPAVAAVLGSHPISRGA